jgi:hypothetical protein
MYGQRFSSTYSLQLEWELLIDQSKADLPSFQPMSHDRQLFLLAGTTGPSQQVARLHRASLDLG